MRQFFLILSMMYLMSYHVAAQPDSLLHTTYALRYKYVSDLVQVLSNKPRPQKALDSLQGIIDVVKEANDHAFEYHLLFARIMVNDYLDRPGNIMKMNVLIQEAEENGHLYEALDGKCRLARHLWGMGNKSKALELALNAYDVYQDTDIKDFPLRVDAQRNLANWYYFFEDYTKVKNLILELEAATPGALANENAASVITLALSYRQTGEYDSALHYFMSAYKSKTISTTQKAMTAGNIGSTYFFLKDYDKAILWVKKELEIWRQLNTTTSLAVFTAYTGTAASYLKNGNAALAQIYIDSASALKSNIRVSFIAFKMYHQVKSEILQASGKYLAALRHKDSVLNFNDSLNKAKNKAHVLAAEKRIAAAEYKSEMLYLENLRKNSLWVRNLIIVAILMLAVIALLLINRSRLKHKQKELLAISEKRSAENKLLVFTKQVQEQNRQIDYLKEGLKHLSDERDLSAKNEAIARLQQVTILTDEQWDEFKIAFEQVYSGFLLNIKDKFPGLTPAELRYLTLLKLNLDNKEIATTLGINVNTVHNYKSRLRRKYAIPDDVSLEETIKNL